MFILEYVKLFAAAVIKKNSVPRGLSFEKKGIKKIYDFLLYFSCKPSEWIRTNENYYDPIGSKAKNDSLKKNIKKKQKRDLNEFGLI